MLFGVLLFRLDRRRRRENSSLQAKIVSQAVILGFRVFTQVAGLGGVLLFDLDRRRRRENSPCIVARAVI